MPSQTGLWDLALKPVFLLRYRRAFKVCMQMAAARCAVFEPRTRRSAAPTISKSGMASGILACVVYADTFCPASAGFTRCRTSAASTRCNSATMAATCVERLLTDPSRACRASSLQWPAKTFAPMFAAAEVRAWLARCKPSYSPPSAACSRFPRIVLALSRKSKINVRRMSGAPSR